MRPLFPTELDSYLFFQGTHFQAYKMLGAHFTENAGEKGVLFSLWAPNAREVRVVGSFNYWDGSDHLMSKIHSSGIWSLFIPGLSEGELYKYQIFTHGGEVLYKADPYAFYGEYRPGTASRICSLEGYPWQDEVWQEEKQKKSSYKEPMLIYEVHLGSWRRQADGSYYSYRELADELVDYVVEMGFTHIEVMPLAEHPFDGSWGYQATGYYAVTSRFGSPQDFMFFVDRCHKRGIGVIIDWVPGHFCKDEHGLRMFDGTPLYEYPWPEKAENLEWGTLSFDLGKPEINSFLISNALFWLDVYHVDGIRIDAVANMLYLDYAREHDKWVPNVYGGHENLEAIAFLKKLNETVFKYFPSVLMIAEESTSWPLVTAPTFSGGLGFNYKWNMGWMNDTLHYMKKDSVYRKYHHHLLTFSFQYAYSENFLLPLSHDEVVHEKRSLIGKMPGDYWQKFANLRAYFLYMYTNPGKKLFFMGSEIAQFDEWKDHGQLDWNLLDFETHRSMQNYVKKLNKFYTDSPAMWELDYDPAGVQWIDADNHNQSVYLYIRKTYRPGEFLVIACNFTPTCYEDYSIGIPVLGDYIEAFNSDSQEHGGSGICNGGIIRGISTPCHNQPYSIKVKIPPLAGVVIKLLSRA